MLKLPRRAAVAVEAVVAMEAVEAIQAVAEA
jgi:enamine deaminase RidA (YjgF/YER057c/UK114 family)